MMDSQTMVSMTKILDLFAGLDRDSRVYVLKSLREMQRKGRDDE